MQDESTSRALHAEVIDLTICTTPETEHVHPAALKRDKSKFNIWSLPPAPGSADGLAEVKQNQASLPSELAPVAKKKKKNKKKKQSPAANQAKGPKLKNRTLRVSEKCSGRVLRLIYNPASSLVDVEFYFKNLAQYSSTIISGSLGEATVNGLDTDEAEKKAFGRLSQMAGADTIEPMLQWGFVGQHLRGVREERGHLNITERFTVRVERTKKQELFRDDPKSSSLGQTKSDCAASSAVLVSPKSPAILPDAVPLLALIPCQPSVSSHVSITTSTPVHHTSNMTLARLLEQDKLSETVELQSSAGHETHPVLPENVTVSNVHHLQVAEPFGPGVEEFTTETEVKSQLRMADDALGALCREFLGLEIARLNLTRKGLAGQSFFDPIAYCRLLEDMKRSTERSQEAIGIAQHHAERLYRVKIREVPMVLEHDEEVGKMGAARIQQVKEREEQLALEQADIFLEDLRDTWGREQVSITKA